MCVYMYAYMCISTCMHVLTRSFICPYKYILNTTSFDKDTTPLGSHEPPTLPVPEEAMWRTVPSYRNSLVPQAYDLLWQWQNHSHPLKKHWAQRARYKSTGRTKWKSGKESCGRDSPVSQHLAAAEAPASVLWATASSPVLCDGILKEKH